MAVKYRLRDLMLLIAFWAPLINAGTYIGLAPAMIQIKTDDGKTSPIMVNFNLGYAMDVHKLELSILSSISDDNLNQLVTDVPISTSLLYRYSLTPKSSFKMDFILGYSQVDITSSYINVPEFTETFSGVSFGLGFEEAFKSIPQLKMKMDIMQLYRGDDLRINTLLLGLRYEF